MSKRSIHVSPARWATYRILTDWDLGLTHLDDLLEKWRKTLSDPDYHLTQALAYGVLRHQRHLDAWIDGLAKQGIQSLPIPIVRILRMAFFQIGFLERIPLHAITNEAVLLCRANGLEKMTGLVNAIIRKFPTYKPHLEQQIRDKPGALAILTSHPDWLVEWTVKRLGEELAIQWLHQNNVQPRVCLYPLSSRITDTNQISLLQDRQCEYQTLSPGTALESMEAFQKGLVLVQDPSAREAVKLLDPQPGERILDACCAPGGKTLQIADLTEGNTEILAVDSNRNRLKKVRENLERCWIPQVKVLCRDLTEPWPEQTQKFDAILLDVPCSGLGTIRRHPDLRYRLQPHDITELADKALLLLRMTAILLRPGGRLVYSTCTLTQEENEGVLQRFLKDPKPPGQYGQGDLAPTAQDVGFNTVTMKYTPSFLFDPTQPIPDAWPDCDSSFCALLQKQ